MANFPQAPLGIKAEVALPAWTDFSTLVYQRNPVNIIRGRQNQSAQLSPSQATFTVNNGDGRWSIRNPTGPWYGQIVQNSPVRFSVPSSLAGISCYLRLEGDDLSYASAPDSVPLQITAGTLSVRADCKPTDGFSHAFLGKWGATGKSWVFAQNSDGTITLFHWDGANQFSEQSKLPLPYFGQRIAVRADYNIAAQTITYYTAPTMAGSWTQLGTVVTTTATALSGAAGQIVQVGAVNATGIFGEVYEAQVYGPVTGTFTHADTAIVQATTSVASQAVTLTGAIAKGDLVCILYGTPGTDTVTDSAGIGTWNLNSPRTNGSLFAWCIATSAAPGGTTITTTGGGSGTRFIVADRFTSNGTIAVGAVATPVTNSGTSGNLGSSTSVPAGALLVGGSHSNTASLTFTAGSSNGVAAAIGSQVGNASGSGFSEYILNAHGGTESVTWTSSGAVTAGGAWQAFFTSAAAGLTLVADPVFTSQTPGATSFADAQGNTWTLAGTSELSGRLYRLHGELNSLPKAANPSLADVWSDASAAGPTQRMQQQQTPAASAMRRAYLRLPSNLNLAAYWPAEDVTGATQIGQATGKFAMTNVGLTMASSTAFACSAPLPVMNGGTATALVDPNSVTWTDNAVRFLLAIPPGDDTSGAVICQYQTTGTVATVQVVYSTGGNLQISGFSAAGVQLFTGGGAYGVKGNPVRVSAQLVNAGGGNITWTLTTVAPGASTGTITSASVAGTIGAVTQVAFGGGLSTSAMGHFSVQGVADNPVGLNAPLNAWNGETAGARFSRLCGEEGIACRIIGPPALSQPMGNQTQQTILSLLQECETTDQGLMFEPRQVLGLGYVTERALCQQPPLATASFSAAQLAANFTPASDFQLLVNDVTMTASSGSTARQFLASGPTSVQSPPSGAGRLEASVAVNPQYDSALNLLSGWFLHVRSADDDRYPLIPFDMARSETPATIPLLDVGNYLQITGTPAWVPPGPVKQLCAGFTETLGPFGIWTIGVNGIPETPYETAILSDAVFGHLDTAGSQLNTGVNTSATSWSVATTSGPLWTTNAGDFPFDWKIAGEQVTVTNITGASSPQTATVTRSVNGVVKSHLAGEAISLFHPMILAL